ncbi:MAG: T9SS type A sorting domain-containing protein [candidate division WOR-3 bacterium]
MIFLAVVLILSTPTAPASPSGVWFITRGHNANDDAWGVAVDTMGYVYWATTEKLPDSSYNDIFIYKIDSSGRQLWKSRSAGGPYNEVAFIAVAKEPFVYIGGRIDASAGGNQNLLLVAYRMTNDTLRREWEYSWDLAGYYEEVDGIGVRDDAIYISGWASPAPLNQDIVVQKLDLNGNLIWSTIWAGTGLEGANGHMALDNSNIYIGSHYGPLNRQGDGLLIAFSQDSGHYLWSETWGRADSDDAFYGLEMGSDSFLYVVGPSPMGLGIYSDINLVKYTRTGIKLWERRWGGPNHEAGRAISIDGDSVVYIAGYTTSYGAGGADIVVLKYKPDGTLLDYRIWGGTNDDEVHDITLAGDYLYLTGYTESFGAGGDDALLIRAQKRSLIFPDTLQGIKENRGACPENFLLTCINPVVGQTPVYFFLPGPRAVRLDVFDLNGRKKTTLIKKNLPAGFHTAVLNPQGLSSGVYFIRLKAGFVTRVAKVIIQNNG